MSLAGSNCTIYDLNDKVVREIKSKREGLFDFDSIHFANFLDGIREGKEIKIHAHRAWYCQEAPVRGQGPAPKEGWAGHAVPSSSSIC